MSPSTAIIPLFRAMGIDPYNARELLQAYGFLRLVHQISPDPFSDDFVRTLDRFDLHIRIDDTPKFRDAVVQLYTILSNGTCFIPLRQFLCEVMPWCVMNQEKFLRLFEENKEIRCLAALISLLRIKEKLSSFSLEDARKFENEALMLHGIDFDDAFSVAFLAEIPAAQQRIKGNINQAINAYRKRMFPMERLFGDYVVWRTCKDMLDDKFNPYLYQYKGIKKVPVEAGRTYDEELFNSAAMNIRDENPTDVIRALFYSKAGKDTRLEHSLVFPLFAAQWGTGKIAVVNPSPDFILACENTSRSTRKRITYFAGDDKVAKQYRQQFPNAYFHPSRKIGQLSHTQNLMLFARNSTPTEEEYGCLSGCAFGAKILVLCPNTHFDSAGSALRQILMKHNCVIRHLLLLPAAIIASSPKKKCLCLLEKCSPEDSDAPDVIFSEAVCDEKGRRCWIANDHHPLPESQLWGSKTLVGTLNYLRQPRTEKEVKRRNNAAVYHFSEEICLHYTTQTDNNGVVFGRAYYCETLPKDSKRQAGKRLTPVIEKGLRGDSKESVVKKLETLTFDSRVVLSIVKDIQSHYKLSMAELSLKTMWFCLRDPLLRKTSYRDDLAKELFCGSCQSLSRLHPNSASEEEYQEAMEAIFSTPWDDIPGKYWNLLNTIFAEIDRERWLSSNPIRRIQQHLSNPATPRRQEVRGATVKDNLTSMDERRIFDYFIEEIPVPGFEERQKRYVVDSAALACAIRLFTGMGTREVCALKWSDFRKIPSLNTYQFIITKYMDQNGNLQSLADVNALRKIRLIPSPPTLTDMLEERKHYLQTVTKLESNQLEGKPLLFDLNGAYTPRQLTAQCKKILAVTDTPEQILVLTDGDEELETDISRYYGDLLQSNFRHCAAKNCGLTNGELCYLLGVAPPDTYSDHYCDYTNDAVQLKISQKLQRWIARYTAETPPVPQRLLIGQDCIIKPYTSVPSVTELRIDCTSLCKDTPLEIQIQTKHGFRGNISCAEGGFRK